jgi:GPH family glycoside/pentoside/hexuronide:cation symporter
MPASQTHEVVGTGEKIGYGLGDTASNVVFQTVVNFLAFYYTDIYGISAATVGTMFLAVRVMDAITDPIMGAICDRTNTRWGKFRPYMLWLAIPFGAAAVITFTTPDLTDTGKVIYAYVTYAVLMLLYTAINIPYCALGGVLSTDSKERVSIQSWRFIGAMTGGLLVTACTLPLVAWLGQGNDALGYQLAMALMSAMAVVMFFVCFATTRERATTLPGSTSDSILRDLQSLWKNDQWRLLALMQFVLLIGAVMRGSVTIYYVNYVLRAPEFATAYLTLSTIGGFIGSLIAGRLAGGFNLKALAIIGAVQLGLLTLFLATGTITPTLFAVGFAAGAVGCLIAIVLNRSLQRIPLFGVLFVLFGLLHFVLVYVAHANLYASFFVITLISILGMIATPLLWSMMADSVDYGDWKTGHRITGMNFSATLFALKLGIALGGAGAGWILAAYNYVPNAEQTAHTISGINLAFGVIPGVTGLLVAWISRYYILSDERMERLQQQLADRAATA